MTKEEIKRLAEKIISGTATEEEIILYNRVCAITETAGHDALTLSEAEKTQLERDLKKAILRNTRKSRIVRMAWFRFTAAAAVLIVFAGVGYFLVHTSGSTKPGYAHNEKTQFKNDVLPGGQGAILTLGNGQKIILDSAANGALASEGGAEVIKKDGAIVYDAKKAEAKLTWNTMTTPLGRQYQLSLADGTQVWLNAGSSITYPTVFTGKQRMVQITGEVYFEVAHNRQMPFVVQKGNMQVEVLGTHFNVNAYDDESEMKVTLLEGRVKVASGKWPVAGGNTPNSNQEVILKPGEQAVLIAYSPLTTNHSPIKINHSPDLDEVMAWKNGRFLFSGTDIGQLMRQLSRWYDVEIVYNAAVKEIFYAEIPRNTKLSDVLKALELTGKVHFAIDGKKIIVNP